VAGQIDRSTLIKFLRQAPRLSQVRRVETFGEAAVNGSQKLTRLRRSMNVGS
jgi:hypothetical protein